MSRQSQEVESRRLFNIVIDEFANFISPSMAEILSGARKYRISMTLAHHELHQLQRNAEVASAVMSHPFTRIVFRVGDDDSKKLAEGFSHFEAKDLRNLETGQAIARVERSDFDFNLSVLLPIEPDKNQTTIRREEIVTASREKYGMLRTDVETMLAKSRTPLPENPPVPSPLPAPVISELPKASEIPKTPAPPSPMVIPVVQREPRDLGRGGEQHKAVQKRIKEAAEELGYFQLLSNRDARYFKLPRQ